VSWNLKLNDAIPSMVYYAQLLVVTYNSDDTERMSRGLRSEQLRQWKIRTGNISEEDAWKFVTFNKIIAH
jgi:hypothetical protein